MDDAKKKNEHDDEMEEIEKNKDQMQKLEELI